MEDLMALGVVLFVVFCFAWIGKIVYRSHKENQRQLAEKQAAADAYWQKQREKINVPTHWEKQSAPKPKKKEPISQTYASMNTQTASTTRTAPVSDDNFFEGVVTGMVVNSLIDSFSHKSEPSVGVSKSESSWGFDDSDSRKSIASSMDTSSWSSSSSDFGSSDSGPSSDW